MLIARSTNAHLSFFWEANYQLAKDGNYRNVQFTSKDSRGNSLCRFEHYSTTGEIYREGQVFQSYFPRFLCEPASTITPDGSITAPVDFTSIYLDGQAISSGDSTSGYRVDWQRGRIIFNQAQDTSLVFSGEFPALDTLLHLPGDRYNRDTVVDQEFWLNSPHAFSGPVLANPYELPWPIIVMRRLFDSPDPVGMGNATKEHSQSWAFDIYAFNSVLVDSVVETIKGFNKGFVPVLNFGDSRVPPMLWDGSRNPTYSGWGVIRASDAVRQAYLYIDSVRTRFMPVQERKVRARVVCNGSFYI